MPVTLSTHATDGSSFVVVLSFTDPDGTAVTPATLTWTLTDRFGSVVNSREDVEVASPSSSENIVLSGDDLLFSEGDFRILTVDATYDSVTYGNGLALRDEVRFVVDNIQE